jgi:hypothetical protein
MGNPIDYSKLLTRRCCSCGETKPVAEFGKFKDISAPINGWRYYSRCSECNRRQCSEYGAGNRPKRNARLKRWRKKHPLLAKAADRRGRLRYKYGLTPQDVETMNREQKGKCAICGYAGKLVVDHCHKTGRVRKLLCASCNTFLGRVENNPQILVNMTDYMGLFANP